MSWTTYLLKTDTTVNIVSQCLVLLKMMSVDKAHDQSSYYYFRMVVTCATFDLIAVAAFLELSKMTAVD